MPISSSVICLHEVCVQPCMAAAEVPEGSAEELSTLEFPRQWVPDSSCSLSCLRTSPVLLLQFQPANVPQSPALVPTLVSVRAAGLR